MIDARLEEYLDDKHLIDNDDFWSVAYEVYRGKDLALPINYDQFILRDVSDLIECGTDCGECCRIYKKLTVTDRDVERLADIGVDIIPHTFFIGDDRFLRLEEGCVYQKDNICTVYKHRPDGCFSYPVQFGYNYDEEGKRKNNQLYIRVACKPVMKTIRGLVRRILKSNPRLVLHPSLSFKVMP